MFVKCLVPREHARSGSCLCPALWDKVRGVEVGVRTPPVPRYEERKSPSPTRPFPPE